MIKIHAIHVWKYHNEIIKMCAINVNANIEEKRKESKHLLAKIPKEIILRRLSGGQKLL
jgi:hypothetical protein